MAARYEGSIHVLFGSDSDESKVLPGIERATSQISGLSVRVHYASADNTPEKVAETLAKIRKQGGAIAYVSGAGMSNALTAVIKSFSTVQDVNIGIPIHDDTTNGVASFFSTAEKPPGNPVLTVGMNNSFAGVNIAYRFQQGAFGRLVVFQTTLPTQGLEAELTKLGLPYEQRATVEAIDADEVVLRPINTISDIGKIDAKLHEGKGIQICVYVGVSPIPGLGAYARKLEGTEASGLVTAGSGSLKNAAYVAAQIMQDHAALSKIAAAKADKAQKLLVNRGWIVTNGKAQKANEGK